jgi:hypothetical protein
MHKTTHASGKKIIGAFGLLVYGPTNNLWFSFQERHVTAFKNRYLEQRHAVCLLKHAYCYCIAYSNSIPPHYHINRIAAGLLYRRRCAWACTQPYMRHFQWRPLSGEKLLSVSVCVCAPNSGVQPALEYSV